MPRVIFTAGMKLRQVFANNVRAYRKAKDWSQEELADRAGLHRTYISIVERGLKNISIDNIEVIAKALGEPAWRLLETFSRT
ncbi:MAG: helix-turn-helix transcriptional regulator [Devosia sp.]